MTFNLIPYQVNHISYRVNNAAPNFVLYYVFQVYHSSQAVQGSEKVTFDY